MNIEEIMEKSEKIESIEKNIVKAKLLVDYSNKKLEREQKNCNHDVLVKLASKNYAYSKSGLPCEVCYCAICHKMITNVTEELEKRTINVEGSIYENFLKESDDISVCSFILSNFLILKSNNPLIDNATIIEMLNKSMVNEEELTRTLHK